MNKDIDINILRQELNHLVENATRYSNDGMLSNACIEFRQAISKAEEIFRLTSLDDDKNSLLDLYNKIAKCYTNIYTTTCNKKDILPACTYYEKIIYFYEDELKKQNTNTTDCLRKIMEVYVHLLWVCLEIKDTIAFERFVTKASNYAIKLSVKSKTYEDEQYYILINIFKGDYYKSINKFKSAYLCYYFAMKKIKKIYNKVQNIGILNDLILIYNNLSEVARILKRNKAKIKWDNIINKLQKESERFLNE